MGFSALLLSFVWTNLASLKRERERKEGGKYSFGQKSVARAFVIPHAQELTVPLGRHFPPLLSDFIGLPSPPLRCLLSVRLAPDQGTVLEKILRLGSWCRSLKDSSVQGLKGKLLLLCCFCFWAASWIGLARKLCHISRLYPGTAAISVCPKWYLYGSGVQSCGRVRVREAKLTMNQ